MINPYANRDTTNRNIRRAEIGARWVATITTSLGAYVWGQDLAARYLPEDWSTATPILAAAAGIAAAAIMGFLTDFMFGNLLQRVASDILMSWHPNVVKFNGDRYFKNLRRAEKFFFCTLLALLLSVDVYTTLIIRDPIADRARQNQTTDIAATTATITSAQNAAIKPMADQIKQIGQQITNERKRVAKNNPNLKKLADSGNDWARQQLAAKENKATKNLYKQLNALNDAYNMALSGQSATLATTQTQITDQNNRTAQINQRNRDVMAGMYIAFTITPKTLAIILRILMVITFLAYSTTFHPDLTGDGIIDYADVEAYYQRQKQAYQERVEKSRAAAPQSPIPNPQSPFT